MGRVFDILRSAHLHIYICAHLSYFTITYVRAFHQDVNDRIFILPWAQITLPHFAIPELYVSINMCHFFICSSVASSLWSCSHTYILADAHICKPSHLLYPISANM